MGDWEQDPGEYKDGIINDFPYESHGIMILEGIVNIVGEQYDNNETEQPCQVDQGLDNEADLGQTVLVNQVVYVQERKHQLNYHKKLHSLPRSLYYASTNVLLVN